MYENLYCKIYLDSELGIEDLYKYINYIVQGKLEPIRTIKATWGEIDLRRNSDFELQRLKETPDDFIFWQYYLDIEPKKDIEESKYITQIANLLKELTYGNVKAVASCDFEERL